ncbi:flagellar protein FliT [Paraburkholderia sp.]|uniref:flagellar protein FliT n=1 Tax=Paraburkholderia sp. TaxID=1926495 RepID=UPI003D6F88EB
MNNNTEYFDRYEAIAALSNLMLSAARRSLWAELAHLEEEYRYMVDALKDAELDVCLNDTERLRKYDLIRRILADDAAIRDLASPPMAKLAALFSPSRPVRVLKELYGTR